ncbi:triacylglycerol lipase 2 [Lathyrus oleraceus]|uniref:Lipase n=1 Tax=Pisum sativum TaxID=3888 RepID=A0A9D5GVY4_PEA|nr:triacylglycerol lipase 2-like [Pisum sativum]KAI5443490.1 hypothetical protein KIW84_012216 [Pisum sativum]
MTFLGLMNSAVLILCVIILTAYSHQAQALGPDFFGEGLCASSITIHGYKCQEFEVTTKDGYILSIQRILEGRVKVFGNVTKEPVILQHGVLVDGATWFLNSPEQNLPMILADNGFDVWVVNSRGTKYSRKHTKLDASSQEYWYWSFDELVAYEMPAAFDFVSKETGQKIHFVGHSMGTLTALLSLAEGKWENQVKSVVLLSPIAYLSRMTTLIGAIATRSLLSEGFTLLGIAEFDPKGVPVTDFVQGICVQSGLNCNDLFTLIRGENCCLDKSAFDDFMKVEPQSSSTRTLFHLSQIVRTDALSKFDFQSPRLNMLHYGRLRPPAYNLSKIPNNIPIFMSYGGADALSDIADVKKLLNDHFQDHDKDKLSVQFIENYAHGDYMFATNANELVYKNVTSFLKHKF